MEHALVRVTDQKLTACERDENQGCGIRGAENPQFVLECLVFESLQHGREIFVQLLSVNPCFNGTWHGTFNMLKALVHSPWDARSRSYKASDRCRRPKLVCEYLDRTTVREIANDPNHLSFQQDNLTRTLKTPGDLVKPGI
jgi:hypothetical protein